MMKALLLSLSLCMASGLALAGPQQEKMKTCNAEAKAKDLKKEARSEFMKTCLSNKPADAPAPKPAGTQQEKMKSCNAEAKTKGLQKEERKKFMSECLSG
jgi:hypothetical protein